MPRYIARFRGRGCRPAETQERIEQVDGTRIIDDSPRMVLVEAPDDAGLRSVLDPATWLVTEERRYRLPTPRKTIAPKTARAKRAAK